MALISATVRVRRAPYHQKDLGRRHVPRLTTPIPEVPALVADKSEKKTNRHGSTARVIKACCAQFRRRGHSHRLLVSLQA